MANTESQKLAQEVAEDAHEYYFNSTGDFKQKEINHVLAIIANAETAESVSLHGKITTTQHDEKVIFSGETDPNHYEFGSYGVTLNEQALSVETLTKDERIEHLKEWILRTATSISDEAESITEQQY